jgi:hypothetical protein
MSDIIGTLLTTPRHPLATSAMPDAPVVEHVERPSHATRRAVAAALHRLAEQVAPDRSERWSAA